MTGERDHDAEAGGPMESPLDRLPGGECPQCGESPTGAHARGAEIVLVPCGHTIDALSALEVPPDARDEP